MGGKCSGTSQNTSKVTHPNREQVQAVWNMQSRANVPSQLLLLQTKSPPVAGVETDQKLPLMVLCVQPSWKGGDLLQPNCQTCSSPIRTVPGMPFPNCTGHTRPPAQEPAWFCLLGRGTTHHLLMAVANQGLHTCSTCMWH